MYQPSVSVPKAGPEQGSEVHDDVRPRRYHLCSLESLERSASCPTSSPATSGRLILAKFAANLGFVRFPLLVSTFPYRGVRWCQIWCQLYPLRFPLPSCRSFALWLARPHTPILVRP
jgi:hypothetical protein